jgi:ankyrin repeat protein
MPSFLSRLFPFQVSRRAIREAVRRGELESVRALLKDHPDLVSSRDNTGATPVHVAAIMGHKDVAEFLLANEADVNARTNDGWTALHIAAVKGHKNIVELLLANKADVNANPKGYTPLHAAAANGHRDVAEILLANHADINARDDHGNTPLHPAAENGHNDVAEFLLANHAEVNVENALGITPLHAAAVTGRKNVAELLLAHGADFNLRDQCGHTPFSCAAGNGHKEVAELLLHKAARATIYVYRPGKVVGAATYSILFADGLCVGAMLNSTYSKAEVPEGTVVFSALDGVTWGAGAALRELFTQAKEISRIQLETERTYYIRWAVHAFAHPKMEVVDTITGETEIRDCSPGPDIWAIR